MNIGAMLHHITQDHDTDRYNLGLDRTGHMSFLTGQDRTPKFARQLLPDRTESGLIFLDILPYKLTKKIMKKIFEKNILKIFFENFFLNFFFLVFFSISKGEESGK